MSYYTPKISCPEAAPEATLAEQISFVGGNIALSGVPAEFNPDETLDLLDIALDILYPAYALSNEAGDILAVLDTDLN